jgi:hypothetical protein
MYRADFMRRCVWTTERSVGVRLGQAFEKAHNFYLGNCSLSISFFSHHHVDLLPFHLRVRQRGTPWYVSLCLLMWSDVV